MATQPKRALRDNKQIAFSRTPPANPSDIHITDEAITEIAKVAGLDDGEREIVARVLPDCLLTYYLTKASKGIAPTVDQHDEVLKKVRHHLREARCLIQSHSWVERAMTRFEVLGLSGSRAAPSSEDFDEDRECGKANIRQELEQLDSLLKRLELLQTDPISQVVAKQQSKTRSATRGDLEFLDQRIHILWERSLGKKVTIGVKSKYFAFARAILKLIDETRADGTLIKRLSAARRTISSLPKEN